MDSLKKKITVGERALNWARATKEIWPIILLLVGSLGWSNKDNIQGWIDLDQADGQEEVSGNGMQLTPFQLQVQKFSQEVRIELEKIKMNSEAIKNKLANKDRSNYSKLKAQIKSIGDRVIAIEKIVQP